MNRFLEIILWLISAFLILTVSFFLIGISSSIFAAAFEYGFNLFGIFSWPTSPLGIPL